MTVRTGLPMLPELRLDITAPSVTDVAATAALLGDPVRAGLVRASRHRSTPASYPSIRSTIVAIPCPTPMHIVASP